MWGWIKPILDSILEYLNLAASRRQKAVSVDPTAGGRRERFRALVHRGLRLTGRSDRP
jgi:hypothetical protein